MERPLQPVDKRPSQPPVSSRALSRAPPSSAIARYLPSPLAWGSRPHATRMSLFATCQMLGFLRKPDCESKQRENPASMVIPSCAGQSPNALPCPVPNDVLLRSLFPNHEKSLSQHCNIIKVASNSSLSEAETPYVCSQLSILVLIFLLPCQTLAHV